MSTYHYSADERCAAGLIPGYVSVANGLEYCLMGFAPNRDTPRPEHARFLGDLVARYQLDSRSPSARVDFLEGYTDGVSSERSAQDGQLRLDRANAVAQELIHRGALSQHIASPRGARADHYLCGNDSAVERTINRAVLLRMSPISGRVLPPLPRPIPVPTPVPRLPVEFPYKIRLNISSSLFIVDNLSFDIIDLTSRQVAIYSYSGVNYSRATPGSATLRGPWNRFTRTSHVSVSRFDRLTGFATFGTVGAGNVSANILWLPFAPGGPLSINPFETGTTLGAGLSAGFGFFSLQFPALDALRAPWPHDVDRRELENAR